MGPSAIRVADVAGRLRALGYDVRDAGDVNVCVSGRRDPGNPRLRFLDEIRRTCEGLRDTVRATLEAGRTPIVLGGDHSIAIGTLAGLSHFYRDRGIGLVWLDAHADSNTPDTSPSGNINGMPLAVALGLGAPELVGLGRAAPMVAGSRAAAVGLRDIDPAERNNVRATGLHAFTMRNVDERGMRRVMEEAIECASLDTVGIHVSFDLDAVDPGQAPGVGTPAPGGLSYREAHLAMEMLADSRRVISAEFVEVNPTLDSCNGTAELAVDLLCSLFGKRIL